MKRFYLVAFLLLGGILAWRLFSPVGSPVMDPGKVERTGKAQSDAVEETLAMLDVATGFMPMQRYPEITARPLFFKERKPPEEYVPATGQKKPLATPGGKGSPPRLSLSAIVGIGKETFALVGVPGSKETRRLKTGDEIEGWKVKAILADRLVLGSAGMEHEIPLREYKPVLPPKAAPASKPGRARKARGPRPSVKRGRPAKRSKTHSRAKVVTE